MVKELDKAAIEISNDIKNKYELLLKSREATRKYEQKKSIFFEIFSERRQWYLVSGIACLLVLVFDYFVSHETLKYLAKLIRIQSSVLALLFSILDGALAILASGGLAGQNTHKKELYRKTFRPILVLFGVVKLILFAIFTYDSYLIVDSFGNKVLSITLFEFMRVLLPQTIFIIIVYSVLTFAGMGLLYIFGLLYYSVYKFLLTDPEVVQNKIRKLFNHLFNLDNENFQSNLQNFKLEGIYKDVKQTENLGGQKG